MDYCMGRTRRTRICVRLYILLSGHLSMRWRNRLDRVYRFLCGCRKSPTYLFTWGESSRLTVCTGHAGDLLTGGFLAKTEYAMERLPE